jgi:glycosyltransferase involved in cell wall biosynthesis
MKISILTATYNRETYLNKLFDSIVQNSKFDVNLEWIIMDDGSTDNTKLKIEEYIENNNLDNLEIKYFFQENQGKMADINNIVEKSTGDLIIECDSDDYLYNNAVKIINSEYDKLKNNSEFYAMAFLRYDNNFCNIGSIFKENGYKSTMFDLYFKDGVTGDKSLVFVADIRKKYKYILEKKEKFVTEASMFNRMDKDYKIICFNQPVVIGGYLEEGYSNNIIDIFKKNPYGYYEYFKMLFDFDMNNILFKKRLYIIKHYILFSYLTKNKYILKNIKGSLNKLLLIILFIPGYIKSYFFALKN